MKLFKNKKTKKYNNKALKDIDKEPIYQIIKEKIRLYDEEQELLDIVLKVISIITYFAVIITTIICDEFIVKYAVLSYMIVATIFIVVTLGIIFIARKFIK